MPLVALILNRVHTSPLASASAPARAAVSALLERGEESVRRASEAASRASGPLLGRAVGALIAQEHLALADRSRIDDLVRASPGVLIVREVPRFGGDVYDLSGLRRLNDVLFSGS
ncbi:hypothetical protein HY251_11970 [bacterium]|nr:hypothetical protein [bacterium]